ncbi:MAG TPA: OB-fold nucleic acid binding domain-containing protein [Thermoanaerobaculia bacterium]
MDEERDGDVEAAGEGTLVENRFHNLEQIRALVGNVYPDRFDATAGVSELVERFSPRSGEELEAAHESVRVAGRILAIRVQGKAGFLDLSDGRSRLQVYVRKDAVGEPAWELFRSLDLGDWIGVAGRCSGRAPASCPSRRPSLPSSRSA